VSETDITQTTTRVTLGEREIIIVGTAHISKASVEEVESVLRTEKPDRVCIELDKARYTTLVESSSWKNIDISKVLKEKKGFLLFANIILASFQKRLGMEVGVKPGEEMVKAIRIAEELGIPTEFCDREVQITLRRAWAKSSFWGKNKMLAALLTSLFAKEKITPEEMEKLKQKNLMQTMLEELSGYLPKVKEVLIDERDRYLATNIFNTPGKKLVAVVGAGHVEGIVVNLHLLAEKKLENDVSALNEIPTKGIAKKVIPWLIPFAVSGLLVLSFFMKGPDTSLNGILAWVIATSASAGIGAICAFGHPLAVLSAALSAPLTALLPIIGSGMVSGLVQYQVRKPHVDDFENLHDDLVFFKKYYTNRVLKVLWVFFLTNLGGSIGTIVGISWLSSLLG